MQCNLCLAAAGLATDIENLVVRVGTQVHGPALNGGQVLVRDPRRWRVGEEPLLFVDHDHLLEALPLRRSREGDGKLNR